MQEKRTQQLGLAVREQIAGYILTACGLIAGLAWNDAVKSLIEFFIPLGQNTIVAKIAYAVVVSFVVVVASVILVRWTKKSQ
jgi:hypothetical protein